MYQKTIRFLRKRYDRAFADYWRLYDEMWTLRPTLSDRQLRRYHWRMTCASHRTLLYYKLLYQLRLENFYP